MGNPIDQSLDQLSSFESDRAEAILSALPAEAQSELLQAVLAEDAYPWAGRATRRGTGNENGLDEEVPILAAAQALEITEKDAAQGWQKLSAQLGAMWAAHDLQASALQQKFANRLPSTVIAHIAEKAQQVTRLAQGARANMTDQMIACVQDLLTHMAEDDLRVMARPMALAMRGSSSDAFVEATIQSVRQAEWAALSPIEQSRLSLAAARYAISQIDLAAEKARYKKPPLERPKLS